MGQKDKAYYISVTFITVTVIFWGYSFISTKVVLTQLPPVSIAFFRQIIACAVLLPWLLVTKSFSLVNTRHIPMIAASSLFGIVLYFVFENSGLKYTTASNASMIVAAVPVFTLISETLFFKLKFNLSMVSCIFVSMIGVYLVISVNGKLDFSSRALLGNILVTGAMVCWVVYTILNKSLGLKYSSILLTFYQMLFSIPLFIPFILPEVKAWKGITLLPLLNLLFLGIFCSAIAYFFFNYSAKRLGPTVSSAFLNLIPVVSVIAGFFVLGERLVTVQLAGMVLILISLFGLSKKKS